MSCKDFHFTQKPRLTEDSEWLGTALQIFLRAHRLLKNFMDFFKFHAGKCYGINYDAVPLHGALDIVPPAIASIICGNVLKKEFQRPGLFHDMFPCAKCQAADGLPENIARKVDVILVSLQRPCAIESIICQIKTVLHILERLAPCAMSEKLQTLSCLLKESMKRLICYGHYSEEPLNVRQAKLTLNLVNNFIRDWSETRSAARPCLRICRFCDRVISETTRQWGMFCCSEAQQFNNIRKEWLLRVSISDVDEDSSPISCGMPCKTAKPETEQLSASTEGLTCSRVGTSLYRQRRPLYRATATGDLEDSGATHYPSQKGSQMLESIDQPIKDRSVDERSATDPRLNVGASARAEKYDENKFEGRDLKKMADRTFVGGNGRDKIKRSGDIDRNGEYPIGSDGREKRDDVPYKGKREIRGLRDAEDERGRGAGKMGRIKRDGERSGRSEKEKSESEERREKKSTATGRRKKRGDEESPERERSAPTERRRKRREEESPEREESTTTERRRKRREKESPERERSTPTERRRKRREEESPEREESTTTERRRKRREKESSEREGSTSVEGRRRKKKEEESREGKKSAPTAEGRRKIRADMSLDGDEEARETKGRRRRKLYRNELTDDEEFGGPSDADEEEREGKRRKKKLRKGGEMEEDETMTDVSDTGKGARGGRKKKASAIDSERMEKSYGVDDETKIATRDKKRRGRSREEVDRGDEAQKSESDDQKSIKYQLSNQHFIKLGWTILPVVKIMKKIVQYQANPAKPHLDWFRRHRPNGIMYYDDGCTVFANFLPDGSAEIYYPNGIMAIKFQQPENRNYEMYTVFSPGGRDCMGVERSSQIIGVFDTMGNGAVFNEDGATRLSYNQIGGIWRDNPTGTPLLWKWDIYEPIEPVTKIVHAEKPALHLEKLLYTSPRKILKSSGSGKVSTSPTSSRNKEKKVEEQKPVGRRSKEEAEEEEEVESGLNIYAIYRKDTYHMKPICFNLNKHVSLRIANRSNVSLHFFANKRTIRIELGTVLDLTKKLDSHFVDSSLKREMLKCKFEDLTLSRLKLNSSLYDVATEFRNVKESAKERRLMMDKYWPYLRGWKMAGTRCRPR